MVDFNSVQSLLLVWKPCVPSNHRSRPTETRSWRTLASIWPVIVDRNPVSNDQRGHPPSSGWRRPEHRQFWTLLAVETSILETPCTPRDPLHGLRVPTAANVAADAPVDPHEDVRA